VVVIAPGFEIPPDQYYVYAEWLAAFGYVAIVDGYPQSLFSPNHVAAAQDLSAALDWATAKSSASSGVLSGLVDLTRAGVSGHSLGGKLSILADSMDPRFKASLLLDPVDGSMSCSAQACPNAIDALPLPIPIGFLGETLDETGTLGQACAPANENFQTLYAKASSPSFAVTIAGAGHMSFVDSISQCGLVCSVCQTPTAPQAQVISMAESYLVAFYELYLRGNAGYATYLTGPVAQSRYVATGEATITAK
jgi:dienelactone hydrolase